jgi:NAD(P)-dependent dehydrogenase (short-subunit alcohol dehydrogenase family)
MAGSTGAVRAREIMEMKRVALVTGGMRGIGLGIAQCLAAEQLDLAVCGMRDEAAVADTTRALARLGADVLYVRADVGDAAARRRLLEAIQGRFHRLDVLVNNAGVAPQVRTDILEATEESFEEVLRTNLRGPYFLTQACANWMIAEKKSDPAFRGCIVNVSSMSATVASVRRGEYCISKAGMSMATQLWAVRLGEYGIPVYEIRPGLIKTDMTACVREKYDKLLGEGLALQGRWGMPEDVGKAVAALVRGDFAYSTGQVISVDGGLTVPRL